MENEKQQNNLNNTNTIKKTKVKTNNIIKKSFTNINNKTLCDLKQDNINLNLFNIDLLKKHNKIRKKHGVSKLKLNKDLIQIAQNYAETMAKRDNIYHSFNTYKGEDLGENIYYCQGFVPTTEMIVNEWYKENEYYIYGNPNSQE